ncbi:uncharacterized protein [Euphorbia lathyris]|uniref:uncharacterized protein n=1 Tax=Euphorbia lathyris TaxID=212925 RepID=UPI003313DFDE
MVLWEITLATAYILGLKRTYRLALKIQRRLVSPKRPKIRQFIHRRIRTVFDVALSVHQNIQQRDIEVGRNIGNWILRWLDKMKPSAQIRGPQPPNLPTNSSSKMNMSKQVTNSHLKTPGSIQTSRNQDSSRHLSTASRNMWSKPFPTIRMMIQQQRSAGRVTQCRNLSIQGPKMASSNFIDRARGCEGVLRKDIMQYIWQNGQ